MQDKESIWIAQREGRANDGNDFTDPSVLKMIHLNGRKTTVLTDYLNNINIIPKLTINQKICENQNSGLSCGIPPLSALST